MKKLFTRAALAALSLTLVAGSELCAMEKTRALCQTALATIANHKKITIGACFGFYLLQAYRARDQELYKKKFPKKIDIKGVQNGAEMKTLIIENMSEELEKTNKKANAASSRLAYALCGIINNNITQYFSKLLSSSCKSCWNFVFNPSFFDEKSKINRDYREYTSQLAEMKEAILEYLKTNEDLAKQALEEYYNNTNGNIFYYNYCIKKETNLRKLILIKLSIEKQIKIDEEKNNLDN